MVTTNKVNFLNDFW